MRFSLLSRAKCRPGIVTLSASASAKSRDGRLRFQVIEEGDSVLALGRLQLRPLALLLSLWCELDLSINIPMPNSSLSSENDPASVMVEGVGTADAVLAMSEPPNNPSTSLVISSRSSAHAALATQSSRILDRRLSACVSNMVSGSDPPRSPAAIIVLRLVCVDIDD
jgi:hypothetical protein